jgi:hypothetical protein
MNANLIAGVTAGMAGLFVFLILHHLWIVPIWFILPFGVVVAAVGGAAGWLIGRSGQAAMATAVAGFIYALGPGHNIPLVGGTPGVGKELVIMAAVVVVSALILRRLTRSHLTRLKP